MDLNFSIDAQKYLDNIPPKHCSQIARKIISLQRNPYPKDYRQLLGFKDYFRVTIGEYRVIYKIVDNVIGIVLIGERNDGRVYQDLKKKIS
jgi:mRNA interferase RelE/StbE